MYLGGMKVTFCFTLTYIDWTFTKDIVSIIGTIGALIIGGFGLSTWRRQLHGTSKYEVAKKILSTTYRLQDAIQGVRSPMLHLKKEEVEAGRELEEEQRIYTERLQRLHEKRAELRTLALEAKAIWGSDGQDCFKPIYELIGSIHAEIWLHFWLKGAYAGPGATVDRSPERIETNNKIIYYLSDDDEFSKRIESSVQEVEKVFQPRLRG